jgi:hypothetical protein
LGIKDCYFENERGQYLYKQESIWKDGVKYDVDIFAFHHSDESRYDFGPIFDTFTLKINTIIDLYKGGKNNLFKITTDYYIFKNETITKYVNYSDSCRNRIN